MKRFLPVFLALVLICSMFTAACFATDVSTTVEETTSAAAGEVSDTASGEVTTDSVATNAVTSAADEEDDGFVNKLVRKITNPLYSALEGKISDDVLDLMIPAIISLFPILECRGGMIAAKMLNSANESGNSNLLWAFLICYIFNMIPVPFILLFIKKIFAFMKKHNILKGFIEKLEGKGEKNREKILRYKQWGLLLFVAIPLPGTGAWTGSLFASLLNIDFKKALPIVAIGVFIANLIMAVATYGAGAIFGF